MSEPENFVTRWSRFDTQFEGVHWRELAALARPHETARFAIAHAEAGFTSNVPLAYLEDDEALLATHADGEPLDHAKYSRDKVLPAMAAVRALGDKLETVVADDLWPLPTYREILFIK